MMGKRKVFDTLDATANAGAIPAGPSVSDTLRETRESLGYDLREVATMLRIRYPYLQAIESGRFDELPGSTYAAGFLRSYAECLGLDPEAIIARYKEEASGKARSQQYYLPTPVPEGRIPGGTVLLGTLVLAGIVYGGWYYLSATDRSMVDLVPTLPDRLVSLLDGVPRNNGQPPQPAPAATDSAVPVPNMTAEAPATPPTATGGGSTATPAPAPAPVASTPAPAAAPAVPATPPAAPAAPAPTASAQAPTAAPTVATPAPAPAAPVPAATVPATPATPAAKPAAKPSTVAALPAAPAPAPAPSAAAPAAPAGVVNVPPPPSEEEEGEATTQEPTPLSPGAPAIAGLPPAPPPTPARGAADAAALPTKVYGSPNPTSRIQLRATQDSWIQVRDGNGEIIFTRVLKPGDVYRVPDRSGIRVRTGNAGGLTVVTDGVEGAPLGAVGQVLRDVPLDQNGVPARSSSGR